VDFATTNFLEIQHFEPPFRNFQSLFELVDLTFQPLLKMSECQYLLFCKYLALQPSLFELFAKFVEMRLPNRFQKLFVVRV
jgi:hypothetical protein